MLSTKSPIFVSNNITKIADKFSTLFGALFELYNETIPMKLSFTLTNPLK
jgi:hypothetical protein